MYWEYKGILCVLKRTIYGIEIQNSKINWYLGSFFEIKPHMHISDCSKFELRT